MSRRRIGQEKFGFAVDRGQHSSLEELAGLIDWTPVDRSLGVISCSAKGEPAWPPMALFKAMLLSIWYDLSDVKLSEALDDRGSFRRFCGFSASEPTPERTAFVRFRKALVAHGLDKILFDEITRQLKAKAIQVKTGTLVDATIIASSSKDDEEGHWVKHRGQPAVHGFKAHVGADADTALGWCNMTSGNSVGAGAQGSFRGAPRKELHIRVFHGVAMQPWSKTNGQTEGYGG